jgi:PAS domain S-box-containing protein
MKFANLIKPGYILSIGLIFSLLMIASAVFELRQSRRDLIQMHQYEGLALLEIIQKSAANSMASQAEIRNQLAERLANNARLLRELERYQPLTPSLLQKVATGNKLYRINVFDAQGNKIASNGLEQQHGTGKYQPEVFFQPILDGAADELDIGLKEARHIAGQRYAVAVRRHQGGAIVINVDAADMLAFGRRIGLDRLFADISGQKELVYAVLQNETGILAATSGVQAISAMATDSFLHGDGVRTRTTRFNDQEVFELVSPFGEAGGYQGQLRIGLHLDEVRILEQRMGQRAVVTSLGVILVGLVLTSVVISSHNYRYLQQEHARIQTYTGNILHAMSDAVLGVDAQGVIRFANTAARQILQMGPDKLIGLPVAELFSDGGLVTKALRKRQPLENIEQTLHMQAQNRAIAAAISVSFVLDERGAIDTGVILLRDQTRRKQLEEQLRRREKLTAMGQLASGVAHEIRNPLNAISMIVQRFQKEFHPVSDQEEYFGLTRTVRSEIERIGQIIRQFLDLARPPKLNPAPVAVAALIRQSLEVIRAQAEAKHIRLITSQDATAVLIGDRDQLHQALLNLLQNAMEAVAEEGTVAIRTKSLDQHIAVEISDDGAGMTPELQKRIFDLYFTTKPAGTGLGLALVHRIVTEHGGEIAVQSSPGQGTTFTLTFPVEEVQSS